MATIPRVDLDLVTAIGNKYIDMNNTDATPPTPKYHPTDYGADFHGHPDYLKITEEELALHSAKNKDYAHDGDPLGNFKRVANILGNYPNLDLSDPRVIAIVYGLKQWDAMMWMLSQGYDGDVENIETRLQDAYIYLKIARVLHREQNGSE